MSFPMTRVPACRRFPTQICSEHSPKALSSAQYVRLVRLLGSELAEIAPLTHINGHGGDELFGPVSQCPGRCSALYPGNIRTLFGFQQVNKKSLSSTIRLLATSGSPRGELLGIARSDSTALTIPTPKEPGGSPRSAYPRRCPSKLAKHYVLGFGN